jgi:hypothetical protein
MAKAGNLHPKIFRSYFPDSIVNINNIYRLLKKKAHSSLSSNWEVSAEFTARRGALLP